MGLGVHENKRQLHGDIPGEGEGRHEEDHYHGATEHHVTRRPHNTHPPRDTTSFTLTL